MFDLEININAWCDYLRAGGHLSEEDVLELESHLREQVDELAGGGLAEEEAFLIGVKRMGNVHLISKEFSKVNTESLWKHLLTDPIDPEAKRKNRRDILLVALFSLLAGTAAKFPSILGIDIGEITYFKNISLYILPFVAMFFAIRNRLDKKMSGRLAGIFVMTAVIVNAYPSNAPNHTEILAGIHLPILLWLVCGVAYAGSGWRNCDKRMDFLRFTGECFIYGSLIMLGLMVMSVFIQFIFESISVNASGFIGEYVLVYGGCAGVMITVYLVDAKKSVVENFAPVLAKIFSPMLLIILVVFLSGMIFTGKGLQVDRNFLIGFDLLLVLALGMVIYTLSAKKMHEKSNVFDYLNVALIAAAVLADLAALFAIAYRLSEYGISPNKMAALGENILMLGNLAGLLWLYIRHFKDGIGFAEIKAWQTSYLTVYAVWMAVVVFVFPLAFGFR